MITIHAPEVTISADRCRLSAKIDFPDKSDCVWMETESRYAAGLTADRCDAFLLAVVYWAMLNHQDIVCKGPVTEQLLYQIREYLIAGLANADRSLHATVIQAETIRPVEEKCAHAVITGMSCGIDSMHVMASLANSKYRALQVTHLLFNRVGAQGKDDFGQRQHDYRLENTRKFAKAQGLELLEVESNLHYIIPLKHEVQGTYRNSFVIFCLQRMISVYFYASEISFAEFDLTKHTVYCGYYDLLSLSAFSIPGLRLYSEGAALSRYDKTRNVTSYPPSREHLNVCFWVRSTGPNCTVFCEKCRRTVLTLDSLGALDQYSSVFDLNLYRQNQIMVLRESIKQYARGKTFYDPIVPFLRRQKPFLSLVFYAYYRFLNLFRRGKKH